MPTPTTVRVQALTTHRCPVTGLRRVAEEIFDLPSASVARRVRQGFVIVLEEQPE